MQTDADADTPGGEAGPVDGTGAASARVAAFGPEEVGIVLLAFGEPASPDHASVVEYLTRIFEANAALEGTETGAEDRSRSRALAERRAPSLLEEYEAIGGSPLNEQTRDQALALRTVLGSRGYDVATYVGTQFTDPSIADAVAAARTDDMDRLIGLPLYPLCGPSTTVASLDELGSAVAAEEGWSPAVDEVAGWHRHPAYIRLRADNITEYTAGVGVDLDDPDTGLILSAHGTPLHYLEGGSRYDTYVEEYSDTLAAVLDVSESHLGYQNHDNRDIPWTEPSVEDVVSAVEADRVIVEPISFIHEQSETLSELDVDLRNQVEAQGMAFHRVPVPHDDPALATVLADLVEPFVAGFDPATHQLRSCHCRNVPGAMCLNAPR